MHESTRRGGRGRPRLIGLSAADPDAFSQYGIAAHLLRGHQRAEPVLLAKPDQFVFVESLDATDNIENLETKPTWVPSKPLRRQIWQSVDGSEPGLLIQTVVKTGEKFTVPLEGPTTSSTSGSSWWATCRRTRKGSSRGGQPD